MTSHLFFLGAAYCAVWVLIALYVWRLSRSTQDLTKRLDALEHGRKDRR